MRLRSEFVFVFTFIVTTLAAAIRAEAASRHDLTGRPIALILNTKNLEQLAQVSDDNDLVKRRRRACEIQREEKIAPTLCYAVVADLSQERGAIEDRAQRIAELDLECRARSLSAARLPAVDDATSNECRRAIERRRQDLTYAQSRDALR